MSDERPTSSTNPARLSANEVANRSFASSFRGLSESEVRAFLRKVGEELEAAQTRADALHAELSEVRARPREVRPLDESELLQALGEETTQLLRSAREAAKDIRAKAEDAAGRVRAEAQQDADRMRAEAAEVLDIRTREADAKAAEMLAEATATADAMRNGAERYAEEQRLFAEKEADEVRARGAVDAERHIEAAKEQGRSILDESRNLRERVLADLTHRRGLLQVQIAELRTGREHLLDAFRTVKRTFVEATESLAAAEARAAESRPGAVDPAEIEAALTRDVTEEMAANLRASLTEQGAVETPADVSVDLTAEETAEETAGESVVAGDTETDAAATPEPDVPVSSDTVAADQPATATEASAEHAGEADAASSDDDGPKPDAHSLFERIRAETEKTGEQPAVDVTGDEPVSADATEETASAEVIATPAVAKVASDDAPEAEADATVDVDAEAEEPSPAEVVHAAITELTVGALRRAKRRAQDEQNELLDALRRTRGRAVAATVLPELATQVGAWEQALREWIEGAYRAGGGEEVTSDLSGALVRQLVEPMRERLELAIDSGDPEEISERVNARYREWKTQQLDANVADMLAGAHAHGVFDTVGDGVTLQWVIGANGCCAECADNVLEPTRRGEPFPTGHRLPPAHIGCRCTIIATTVGSNAELTV